jgi:hypothetical protein
MVRHRERQIRPTHFATGQTQRLKGLRTRHFVDEVSVDEDETGAIVAAIHDMGIPDFFVKCARA